MISDRYTLSFTTGGLFLPESVEVAFRYLVLRDWKATRAHLREANLLQVRTVTAAQRIGKEIVGRLQHLDISELEELIQANSRDQGYLLWAAVCRRYVFIREFAIEVVREHHLLRRLQVSFQDYDAFYGAKALWHAELDALALSTQKKLRQNLFRMLREADLISEGHRVQPALLGPTLARLLARRGREELLVFPASDGDIQRWLQCP